MCADGPIYRRQYLVTLSVVRVDGQFPREVKGYAAWSTNLLPL